MIEITIERVHSSRAPQADLWSGKVHAVPRVGEHVEIGDEGYTVQTVMHLPETGEIIIRVY